jgi:hypothetical protein
MLKNYLTNVSENAKIIQFWKKRSGFAKTRLLWGLFDKA